MRGLLNHWMAKAIFALGFSAVAAQSALGQAQVAAQRGAELSPFVQTTYLSPDWGPTNDFGYTFGVDYTRLLRSMVQPSLEFRYAKATGSTVDERMFAGGVRVGTTVLRLHPYATLLAGSGKVTAVYQGPNVVPYTSAFLYAFGGGLEIPVTSSWKVRADFLEQHWNTKPNGLTPVAMSIGVSYRLPFGNGGWEH